MCGRSRPRTLPNHPLNLPFHPFPSPQTKQTWNTIASVEDRTGAAVPGVLLVWLSVVNAVRRYHETLPLAGKVMAALVLVLVLVYVLVVFVWLV